MSTLRLFQTVNKRALYALAGATAVAGTLVSYDNNKNNNSNKNNASKALFGFGASAVAVNQAADYNNQDYQAVYNAIANQMIEHDDWDNGIGLGPVLVRLAWHSSGTYDRKDGSGGSYGGTYRFSKEANDPANAGLQGAARLLGPIKEQFPWISHGDLYTLGGVVAIQEMQGPKIPWRAGRVDAPEATTPDNGRLPDATQGADYVRNLFARLNMNDRETVALIGAHCLGRTHLKNSGFDGPWGAATNTFTNEFFVNLLNEEWTLNTNKAGNKQYDNKSKTFMMLPADFALTQDSKYLKLVQEYASNQDSFFKDFSSAFAKLLDNGIKYPKSSKPFLFKTLDEQ